MSKYTKEFVNKLLDRQLARAREMNDRDNITDGVKDMKKWAIGEQMIEKLADINDGVKSIVTMNEDSSAWLEQMGKNLERALVESGDVKAMTTNEPAPAPNDPLIGKLARLPCGKVVRVVNRLNTWPPSHFVEHRDGAFEVINAIKPKGT